MEERWIVIPNWERFQHYKDRVPPWIKLHLELSDKDEWRRLTLAERGLLCSIWITYARTRGVVRASELPAFVRASTRQKQLTSLSDAGFIRVVASKPLAQRRIKEKREETTALALEPETPEGRNQSLELAYDLLERWKEPLR